MSALFLTEAEVESLLTMEIAVAVVEEVFRRSAAGESTLIPRARARTDHAFLHMMGAAVKTLGVMASKVYTSTRGGARFLVHLYDGSTGELLVVMEGDYLGAVRTGATSAVATELMAGLDANTVGILGSGRQARTQLEGVAFARDIVEAYVYSPNEANRTRFAEEMSSDLGIPVVAVSRPELAVEDKDIVITATSSAQPVLMGDWLNEGVHINAIGSNMIYRKELDKSVLRMVSPIVVDDREQARFEAGDLIQGVEDGVLGWPDVAELAQVVAGRTPGRHNNSDVTLFKSVGTGLEDLAVAKAVYDLASRAGVGQQLPF